MSSNDVTMLHPDVAGIEAWIWEEVTSSNTVHQDAWEAQARRIVVASCLGVAGTDFPVPLALKVGQVKYRFNKRLTRKDEWMDLSKDGSIDGLSV